MSINTWIKFCKDHEIKDHPMKNFLLRFKKLHDAVMQNDMNFIRQYISCGLNLDKTDRFGDTALCTACRALNVDLVELLLRSGANPHLKNKEDMTALCILALKPQSQESIKILDLLLHHQTDVNQAVYPIPLESAILNRNFYFVEKLIEHTTVWGNALGESYLHLACMQDNTDILRLLLNKISPHVTNSAGDTPLHVANSQTIPHLMAAGADSFALNQDLKTPWMVFANKDLNALKIMVELTDCTENLSRARVDIEKVSKPRTNMAYIHSVIDKKINYLILQNTLTHKTNHKTHKI